MCNIGNRELILNEVYMISSGCIVEDFKGKLYCYDCFLMFKSYR